MTDEALLQRITLNPAMLAGKPVVAGTRLSVEFVVNLLAHGATEQEILAEYPRLTPDDIQACLLFAARSLQQASFMPLGAGTAADRDHWSRLC
jgi:uncharacterized protein (DUF433 family)